MCRERESFDLRLRDEQTIEGVVMPCGIPFARERLDGVDASAQSAMCVSRSTLI